MRPVSMTLALVCALLSAGCATERLGANMPDGTQTVNEYTAGTTTRIPYGQDSTADRSVGWRGAVFVITTTPKQGGAQS